ncbi:MAG: lipoate--protein ligase [Bacillota bacterium]|nr:lipoate--protein ligase [Bacillota bacterium]
MSDHKLQPFFMQSNSCDPWYNLAVEEYLFSQIGDQDILLFLWQNEKTVVIGKNQNAWKECLWQLLEQDGGKLARRLSGGGAVYHDIGNLNFTLITTRKNDHESDQMQMLLHALQYCGIDAAFSGRNDLCVQNRKFSGMASYINSHKVLKHGTLLLHTDLDNMARYLTVSPAKIKSKGVDSVQARVINLQALNKDLTVAKLGQALQDSFRQYYGDAIILTSNALDETTIKNHYDKYASWEWRFGTSPDFDVEVEHSFNWGSVNIGLSLKDGLIQNAALYSDAMDCVFIEILANAMIGHPLNATTLLTTLSPLPQNALQQKMLQDILRLVLEKP